MKKPSGWADSGPRTRRHRCKRRRYRLPPHVLVRRLDALARVRAHGRALAYAALRRAPDLRRVVTEIIQDSRGPKSIAAEDAAWEGPHRGACSVSAPVLSVDGFEGPLDWLLEMVRAQKIDLARLSVAALIEAFARERDAALARRDNAPVQLTRWGDWLVMAATLAHLRSRLLLPADAPEAKAAMDEAEELRRQLVGRAQMQAAAAWLDRQPQLGQDVFL